MDIAKLKLQLSRDEGVKPRIYPDSMGIPTIGVGRNLKDVGLSQVEIDFLLTNDIQRVQADLNFAISWWAGLSDNRQLVVANMCFNLGISGLMQFKNFLAALKLEQFDSAAEHMLDSEWAIQVGARAERLAEMIRKG